MGSRQKRAYLKATKGNRGASKIEGRLAIAIQIVLSLDYPNCGDWWILQLTGYTIQPSPRSLEVMAKVVPPR